METEVFLAFNRKGFTKATKSKSSLARDEIGVMVRVQIPDSAFRASILEARLQVPEDQVVQPEIEMDVVTA